MFCATFDCDSSDRAAVFASIKACEHAQIDEAAALIQSHQSPCVGHKCQYLVRRITLAEILCKYSQKTESEPNKSSS